MKKLLVILILMIVICMYINLNPEILQLSPSKIISENMDGITKQMVKSFTGEEGLEEGNLDALLPVEQMKSLVEEIDLNDPEILAAENPVLKGFLEKQTMTPEKFFKMLEKPESAKELRQEILDYLEKRYCEENHIKADEADPEALSQYQSEKMALVVENMLEYLQVPQE